MREVDGDIYGAESIRPHGRRDMGMEERDRQGSQAALEAREDRAPLPGEPTPTGRGSPT